MISRRAFSSVAAGLFGKIGVIGSVQGDIGHASSPQFPAAQARAILNASDFGALGDGRADDWSALQRFIDKVVQSGQKGYIPAGTYRISQPLLIGDRSNHKYRGFTIEGAGRVGPESDGIALGGTLIILDAPLAHDAVVLWCGNAWRDARLTSLGLACSRQNMARFGLLIESSEISHLEFDHLHIQHVTTAFGLLRGGGANGEFCGWSHIQTWDVDGFFFSDAGQAYGLRFRDIFCYYRPGGVLFTFDTDIVGGGMRLINFDASPVRPDVTLAPRVRADTTLFALAGKHNAPITVIGGRMEHITTLVNIETSSADLVVHNQIQFIGSDFTTDLDRAALPLGRATVRLRSAALADIYFSGCSFATALPTRLDMMVAIIADKGCRGSIRFEQCGHWGYAQLPSVTGPIGTNLRISWTDCVIDQPEARGDWQAQTMGGRFDRRLGDPVSINPTAFNSLLHPNVTGISCKWQAEFPWQHVGANKFGREAEITDNGVSISLLPKSGIYQDLGEVLEDVFYSANIKRRGGEGLLRFAILDVETLSTVDELLMLENNDVNSYFEVKLSAFVGGNLKKLCRILIYNLSEDELTFELVRQRAGRCPDNKLGSSITLV